MFARMKDNRAQMMDVKIIYLQRIQSYQVAKSSLRQEANTFDILKLHCRRFYTSLRGKYYPRYQCWAIPESTKKQKLVCKK